MALPVGLFQQQLAALGATGQGNVTLQATGRLHAVLFFCTTSSRYHTLPQQALLLSVSLCIVTPPCNKVGGRGELESPCLHVHLSFPHVQALSKRQLLNCLTICKQVWYDGASTWAGVSCLKNKHKLGCDLQGKGHRAYIIQVCLFVLYLLN